MRFPRSDQPLGGRALHLIAVLSTAVAVSTAGCAVRPATSAAGRDAVAPPTGAADPSEIAAGVYLVPGVFVPGRPPDGNSIVFSAPEGAIVVDTGRHPKHTQAVLDRVASLGLVPRVVVNTHWHLDHVGGNLLVRQLHPGARIYASDAMAEARTGFLANYHRQLEEMLASDKPGAEAKEGWRREIALIDAGDRLAPDEIIAASGPRTFAGRPLEVHLESHAVTAGDLWILDPATRVLVAGDLVTFPGPFLDTACPAGWQTALAHLAQADWDQLVPGHGRPLTRQDFDLYRRAFDGLLTCAASSRPSAECVAGWFSDGGDLVVGNDPGIGHELVAYYVDEVLRGDPAKIEKLCMP